MAPPEGGFLRTRLLELDRKAICMSLINEALKRAGRIGPPRLPGSGSGTALRPVETRSPRPWGGLVWSIVSLTVLILAATLLGRGWNSARSHRSKTAQVLAAAREVARRIPKEPDTSSAGVAAGAVVEGGELLPAGKPAKPVSSGSIPELPAQGAVAAAATPSAVVDPPPRPSFPPLKLRGIFFRATNSAALIDAKTVYVGDKIERAKVVAIDRESVALEWYGETNVLTLH